MFLFKIALIAIDYGDSCSTHMSLLVSIGIKDFPYSEQSYIYFQKSR